MDEAMRIALEGLRSEVGQVRHDMSELRDDFRGHVQDDKKVWSQVEQWSGALKLVAWCSPATLIAILVLIIKHW